MPTLVAGRGAVRRRARLQFVATLAALSCFVLFRSTQLFSAATKAAADASSGTSGGAGAGYNSGSNAEARKAQARSAARGAGQPAGQLDERNFDLWVQGTTVVRGEGSAPDAASAQARGSASAEACLAAPELERLRHSFDVWAKVGVLPAALWLRKCHSAPACMLTCSGPWACMAKACACLLLQRHHVEAGQHVCPSSAQRGALLSRTCACRPTCTRTRG